MKKAVFGYFVFVVACIVFSMVVHFPGRTAATYIEHTFSRMNSRLTLTVDTVSPCFPVGMKADTILVKSEGKSIANLDNFKFLLNLNAILGEALAGTFKTDVFEGVLSGTVNGALETPEGVETEITLENLNLKNQYLGEALFDCEFSGILNGTITAGLNPGLIRKGSGDVNLTDIVLQFPAPVFSIEKYVFSTGKIKFEMPDSKTIRIEDAMLKGRHLDIQSSGNIRVLKDFQKSRLNMKAKIVLYPLFFMDAGDAVPIDVSKSESENVILHLRIGGTVQKPIINMDPGIK